MTSFSAAPLAADRRAGWLRLVPLAAATSLSVGLAVETVASTDLPTQGGFVAGVIVTLMAIFLLRSVPVVRCARGVILLGLVLMARFGRVAAEGGIPTMRVLAWGIAACVALVLAHVLESSTSSPITPRPWWRAASLIAASVCLVVAGMLLVGPASSSGFSSVIAGGDDPVSGESQTASALRDPGQLDMTTRPRLTDQIVFSVRADRPSFWRTSVYDEWDGRVWSHLDAGRYLVADRVQPGQYDVAAASAPELRQEVRIEAPYADLMPTAPSVVEIDAAASVAQTVDGDVGPAQAPLGKGATYAVVSRQPEWSVDSLRASTTEATPVAVTDRYAALPVSTQRVRDLARRITAGIEDRYDIVMAVQAWMGDEMTYSLDAPLSPEGVDVVDHFLFESKEGWCEQIASSLVVLLRTVGVPARLATGYVSGDRDSLSGRYQVRENDAHAWTEVWFPSVGWVPFDPTSSVPFTGGSEASSFDSSIVGAILLALAVLMLIAGPVWVGILAVARRLRRSRSSSAVSVGPLEARLEELGVVRGRVRTSHETATAFARTLAEECEDGRVAAAGVIVDRIRYGSSVPDSAEERAAADVVEELLSRVPSPD